MTVDTTADQPVVTAPSAADLLLAWEWGIPADAAERSVVLLAALLPGQPTERITSMSVGERDLHLLHARRMLFGPQLECVMSCPACSVELELSIGLGDLLERASTTVASDVAETAADVDRHGEVEAHGWHVHFRLIELQDLIDAAPSNDPQRAREILLGRCVVEAVPPDGDALASLPDDGLPPEVEHAVLEEMQRRDRMRPLDFQLTCSDCDHVWLAPFDILGFLWAEIDGWAHRTLREVHLLAATYGWRERDILELSTWRREAYLQLSGHA